ncbi:TonB-dependent siderophore receptor [Burkholderia stagnalis]
MLTLSVYQIAHAAEQTPTVPSETVTSPAIDSTILPAVTVIGQGLDRGSGGPVRGYVAEQSGAGTKTDTSILEIPQSVSIVTRDQMDLQQPQTTSQSLRYTAGANSEKYGAFGDQLDFTKIRGVDADYYLDGLRIIGNAGSWAPQIDPFTLERIEVLRGPSSYLYGQGTGGGVVNQVSRRPEDTPSHEVTAQFGNFGRKYLGIDTTGPLNSDKTLLYRFTATGLDTNGQIEDARHKRMYLSPSLTWKPSSRTSWTILATHSREPEIPNYNSLPAALLGLDGSPYPQIDRHRNYRDMAFDDSSRKQDSIGSIFQHTFDNGWGFTNNMRYMHIASNLQRSTIYGYQVVNGIPALKSTYELSPSSSSTFSMDNYLHGSIDLGPTKHNLLVGTDFATGTLTAALYSDGPYLVDPYGNDYRRSIVPDFTASRAAPWTERQQFNRIGVYAQDQIAYDRWRLTLGARYDRSSTDDWTQSYTSTATYTRMDDRKWTGRAGLSYQFDNGVAPYVSYSTAFNPVLGSGYDGKAFVPTDTAQYEIGVKFHPANSRTLLTAAIFNLEQTNVVTADSAHLGFNTQAGKVRSRGVDLSATTELVRNLNLIASYTYLDNILVQGTTYQGKSLAQIPKQSASAWLDYLIARGPFAGLQIGAGVRYLGSTWGDPANTFKVPSTTLFDLVLNYDLQRLSPVLDGTTVALDATNLTNRKYIASCTSAMYCFVGQDRTITVTLTYRW